MTFILHLLVFFAFLANASVMSKPIFVGADGCNHPLEEGIVSSKKMIEILKKQAVKRKNEISVKYNKDTCYIVTSRIEDSEDSYNYSHIKFFNDRIVEVCYFFEFSNEDEKDYFSTNIVEILQKQTNHFTEISNDKAIHSNAKTFWNFISLCEGKKFMLAVSVETLHTVKPTVCITYLY